MDFFNDFLSLLFTLMYFLPNFVNTTTTSVSQCKSPTIFANKSSLGGLVGQSNNANFGKSFFILLDTFQHIAYGHGHENYDFNYWIGRVYCKDGFDSNCDKRACPVGGGKAYCDKTELEPYCKCKYPRGSPYKDNCDPPKLILDISNYYYGKGGSPDTETRVRTLNFITTCKFAEGQTEPPKEPEPIIIVNEPTVLGEDKGWNITISVTSYVHVPNMPVYFWLVNSVSIILNTSNLGLILEKIGTQSLGGVLSKQSVNEIAKLQRNNLNSEM